VEGALLAVQRLHVSLFWPSASSAHSTRSTSQRNDDFPDCLACGSLATKEHHFVQTWCRGECQWTAESLCTTCHSWSWRSYFSPAFLTAEDNEKFRMEKFVSTHGRQMEVRRELVRNPKPMAITV
jgi:hypothetical protein